MSSGHKRESRRIGKINERYFVALMFGLCEQPFRLRLQYAIDILLKRWKRPNESTTNHE